MAVFEILLIQKSSRPCRILLLLSACGVTAFVIYIATSLLAVMFTLLVALLLLREYRALDRAPEVLLKLRYEDNSILLEQGGQTYFFGKYKVYPTRWFAILRLVDQRRDRILFLNPNRFRSVLEYQNLRYQLGRQERRHAA